MIALENVGTSEMEIIDRLLDRRGTKGDGEETGLPRELSAHFLRNPMVP